MDLLSRIHVRLGDLWWYTILLFCAQRIGDVINLFVGVWLVPKYVPQNELGAVMPLTQFANFVGVPLAIVAIPFMKYLNVFAERKEFGKVKSLLRDVFIGTGAMIFVTFILAWLTIPFFFERMRVATGSLGLLVVGVSLMTAVSQIFQNSVQGLKLYSSVIWFNMLIAPVRLVVMVLAMPFRAISGYFVGQGASCTVPILGALWVLRKHLGREVKTEPYWREHGQEMLRYSLPVAVLTVLSTLFVSVDMLVIRHRLSDFESAGYYIINTFAMVAAYLGGAFVTLLFPMAASDQGKKGRSLRTLFHALSGSFVSGVLVSVFLLVFGRFVLGLSSVWRPYQSLSYEMFLLGLYNVEMVLVNCFMFFEMAQGRFRFLWYHLPVFAVKMVSLYCLTGYSYFDGILPGAWLEAVAAFNPCRLVFILEFFLAFHFLALVFYGLDTYRRWRVET